MGLSPNIFDFARIERLLKSINSKVGTMESIMIENDDEIREDLNTGAEDG